MKKLILAILTFCSVLPAMSQVRWNVKAGLGVSNFRNLDVMNSRFSYRVGTGVDIPFRHSRWSLQPTLYFSGKGAKFSGFYGGEQTYEAEFGNKLYYLELPIMAAYKLPLGESVDMLFMAGPYVGLGLAGRATVKTPMYNDFHKTFSGNLFSDDVLYDELSYLSGGHTPIKSSAYNRFDAGMAFGLGLHDNHILFGIEGMWGFTSVCQDLMNDKMKNFTFYLSLGYQF